MSHTNTKKIVGILSLILLTFLIASFVSSEGSSTNVNFFIEDSCYDSNAYSREITFSNPTEVDNYQIKIELTQDNFDYSKSTNDGRDLRFYTNSGDELEYYIEKWNENGDSTIYVKITNKNTSEILMQYGNSALASQSNPENALYFYDNFEDDSNWIFHNDWNDIGAVEFVNGKMRHYMSRQWWHWGTTTYTKQTLNLEDEGYVIEFDVKGTHYGSASGVNIYLVDKNDVVFEGDSRTVYDNHIYNCVGNCYDLPVENMIRLVSSLNGHGDPDCRIRLTLYGDTSYKSEVLEGNCVNANIPRSNINHLGIFDGIIDDYSLAISTGEYGGRSVSFDNLTIKKFSEENENTQIIIGEETNCNNGSDDDQDDDGYNDTVDCDDTNPNVNPGMTEICNGIDDNCDGNIDENDVCNNETCNFYWWFDNENDDYCQYDEFCGSFVYLGLRTFNTLEECNNTLNNQTNETDTTPPSSISFLTVENKGETWIKWVWDNPSDNDFAFNIIYLNGNNVANTSNNFYRAANLNDDTTYTITIHTIDYSGNINDTNITNSAKTDKDNGDDDDDDDDDRNGKNSQDIVDSYIDLGLAKLIVDDGEGVISLNTIAINSPSEILNGKSQRMSWLTVFIIIISILIILLIVSIIYYWVNN